MFTFNLIEKVVYLLTYYLFTCFIYFTRYAYKVTFTFISQDWTQLAKCPCMNESILNHFILSIINPNPVPFISDDQWYAFRRTFHLEQKMFETKEIYYPKNPFTISFKRKVLLHFGKKKHLSRVISLIKCSEKDHSSKNFKESRIW